MSVLSAAGSAAGGIEVDVPIGELALCGGGSLPEVQQRVTRYGAPPKPDGSNVVVVPHGLTANSRCGDWWPGIVGPGALFDTARWHAIGVAALGGRDGTTGPVSFAPDARPYGARFPQVDVRDMVTAQRRALVRLGIERVAVIIGASLGGMQALRWALDGGEAVGHAIVVGADDHVRALAIGIDVIGREALKLDPVGGLRLARMIATLTYKSDELFERRHGNRRDRGGAEGRFDIEGYLVRQGDAFVERFDADTYATLTAAMDAFDVREAATWPGPSRITFVGLGGDWLFRPEDIERTASRWRCGGWNAGFHRYETDYGHDAFLTESAQLASQLRSITGAA